MTITVTNLNELTALENFGETFDDAIVEALDIGAQILVKETRKAIKTSIKHPDKSTGDLIRSVKAKKVRRMRGTGYYAAIAFDEESSNGTPNGLKAAEMEYGNIDQTPRPFADRAVYAAEGKVREAVENHLAKELGE